MDYIIQFLKGEFIMSWLTDELLFYGGIAVAVGSLVMAILSFCILQIKKIRLNAQMDYEYGKKEK